MPRGFIWLLFVLVPLTDLTGLDIYMAPETVIAVGVPRGCGKNARALIYTLSGQFCVTEEVPDVVRKLRTGKPDAE
jgi:hypothetical protein